MGTAIWTRTNYGSSSAKRPSASTLHPRLLINALLRWWHSIVRKSTWIFKSHQYCTHDSYAGIITLSIVCWIVNRSTCIQGIIDRLFIRNSEPLHFHFESNFQIWNLIMCGIFASVSINKYHVLFTYFNGFIIVFVVYIDHEESTRGKSSKFVSNDCSTRLGRPPNYWYQSVGLLLVPFRFGRSPATVIFASDMRFTVNYLMDDLNDAWDKVKYDIGEIRFHQYKSPHWKRFHTRSFRTRESYITHMIRNNGYASLQWHIRKWMRINLVMDNVERSSFARGCADAPN